MVLERVPEIIVFSISRVNRDVLINTGISVEKSEVESL